MCLRQRRAGLRRRSVFNKFCAFGAKGRPPVGQKIQKYMHLFGKGLFLTSFVPSALRAGLRRVIFLKSTCTLWKRAVLSSFVPPAVASRPPELGPGPGQAQGPSWEVQSVNFDAVCSIWELFGTRPVIPACPVCPALPGERVSSTAARSLPSTRRGPG